MPCPPWTWGATHPHPEFLSQPYASSVATFSFSSFVFFNVSLLTQGSKGSRLGPGHQLVAGSSAVPGAASASLGRPKVTNHQTHMGRSSLPLRTRAYGNSLSCVCRSPLPPPTTSEAQRAPGKPTSPLGEAPSLGQWGLQGLPSPILRETPPPGLRSGSAGTALAQRALVGFLCASTPHTHGGSAKDGPLPLRKRAQVPKAGPTFSSAQGH